MRGEEKRAEAASLPTRPRWQGARLSLKRGEQDPSLGPTQWRIVITRKVLRLATQRNRWRRRVREILRRNKDKIQNGYQATLKVHTALSLKFTELESEILELLAQSGLMIKKEK